MLLLIVPEQVRVCHFFHAGTVIVICSCSLLLCFFSPVVQSIWKSFFDFGKVFNLVLALLTVSMEIS
jgi:hypothetical protein